MNEIIVEDMESIKYNLRKINTDMVELHCLLNNNTLSNEEFDKAKNMYAKLKFNFDLLNCDYNSYVDEISKKLTNKKSLYSRRSKYFTIFAIIPGIGLFLAVYLVLRNYNKLLEARASQEILDKFVDEISPNIKIISEMLERKKMLIRNLTNNVTRSYTKLDLYSIIEELLNNEDYKKIDQLNSETKKELLMILQKDLNTDCNDILLLLKEEKKKNTKKLVKKLGY